MSVIATIGQRLGIYAPRRMCQVLLESDPTFRTWNANVLRAPHNTGSDYILRMGYLCD
jgi:hypothetical protein